MAELCISVPPQRAPYRKAHPVTLRYLVSSSLFRDPVHGYLAILQCGRCVRSRVSLTLSTRTSFESGGRVARYDHIRAESVDEGRNTAGSRVLAPIGTMIKLRGCYWNLVVDSRLCVSLWNPITSRRPYVANTAEEGCRLTRRMHLSFPESLRKASFHLVSWKEKWRACMVGNKRVWIIGRGNHGASRQWAVLCASVPL